jgi:hypothetical protein
MKLLTLAKARTLALALCALLLSPAPASAAVELTLYAREIGNEFPHGFVALAGTPDRGGARIESAYGFTAASVTPAILFGSVRGVLETLDAAYVGTSEAQVRLALTDAEYDALTALVARWQALEQPSYNLNRRNCIHFVAEVATLLGMRAEVPRNLTRRPRAYMELMIRTNRDWLARRGAQILREPGEAAAPGRRG